MSLPLNPPVPPPPAQPMSAEQADAIMRAAMARAFASPAGALLAARGWRRVGARLVRPPLWRRVLNRLF